MIPDEIVTRAREMAIAEVAIALGASDKVRTDERGVACPGCGGKDRFSVDAGKNVFLCRMAGTGGDPIALVRHVHSIGFAAAVEMLTGDIQAGRAKPASPEQDNAYRQKARRNAYGLWRQALPAGRLVDTYFEIRGLRGAALPRDVREVETLAYWHRVGDDNRVLHTGPAMVAAITGPDGHFIGLHRTWLDFDRPKGKALILDPETGEALDVKKVMGSQRGGKIVLRNAGGQALDLGEGIETAIAFDLMHGDRTRTLWCGVNLDNIAGKAAEQIPHPTRKLTTKLGQVRTARIPGPTPDFSDTGCLIVPDHFRDVRLIGDGDSDAFATTAAMSRAERRMGMPGRAVAPFWAPAGKDFGDVMAERARDVAA